jgi:hypothetical protein
MRMMLYVTYPTERFNEMLKEGRVGPAVKRILEDIKPEAVYFGERENGERGAIVVVDMPTAADLSRFTEPWYLTLGARVQVRVAMTPEDVERIDLDALAKKYG